MFIFLFCSQLGSLTVSLSVYQTLQDTLAYATALLNEKEQSGSSNGSDGSPANENADRSLRQVAFSFTHASCLIQWASYMTHYSRSCSVHAAKKRIMDQKWNISLASVKSCKGSLLPPMVSISSGFEAALYSSLAPAVPDRLPRQQCVRIVGAQPWMPQIDTTLLCRNCHCLAHWYYITLLCSHIKCTPCLSPRVQSLPWCSAIRRAI